MTPPGFPIGAIRWVDLCFGGLWIDYGSAEACITSFRCIFGNAHWLLADPGFVKRKCIPWRGSALSSYFVIRGVM